MTPGAKHFGMDGTLLQEYLLQLIKKENSLLDLASEKKMSGAPSNGSARASNAVPTNYPSNLAPSGSY